MDYPRLKYFGLIGVAFALSACVTQMAQPTTTPPKTFFNSSLPPGAVLSVSEQYLEWQKGYSVRVRDHERGLAVTDWAFDSPGERHRITLRATPDVGGSLLSAHAEAQSIENQEWKEIPTNGAREEILLTELKAYIETSSATHKQNSRK